MLALATRWNLSNMFMESSVLLDEYVVDVDGARLTKAEDPMGRDDDENATAAGTDDTAMALSKVVNRTIVFHNYWN